MGGATRNTSAMLVMVPWRRCSGGDGNGTLPPAAADTVVVVANRRRGSTSSPSFASFRRGAKVGRLPVGVTVLDVVCKDVAVSS